ncbi:MAG: hypothetical protein ACK559_18725, partial [bacterium]
TEVAIAIGVPRGGHGVEVGAPQLFKGVAGVSSLDGKGHVFRQASGAVAVVNGHLTINLDVAISSGVGRAVVVVAERDALDSPIAKGGILTLLLDTVDVQILPDPEGSPSIIL